MAPFVLEGATLGEKHRSYNKLVHEGFVPADSDDDLQILLKIDNACKNRDVNYILDVLRSEDLLHVSKAIKRSSWLITDPQYAHIINPEYLYTQLYPHMTSKAFNKLMLNIRLQLKDQKRVEEFYKYIKNHKTGAAYKWLQHCSVQFVEEEVVKCVDDIPDRFALRLYEKSFSIFQKYKLTTYTKRFYMFITKEAQFLAVKYPDKFLDFLKSLKQEFTIDLPKRATKALMKSCYQKVLVNFEFLGRCLDLETFVKCLKKKESLDGFLIKHIDNKNLEWMYLYDNMLHFISNMPKEIRFDFVKKAFINKEKFIGKKGSEMTFYSACAYKCAESNTEITNSYQLYKFAPFDIAFIELKKLIRAESSPSVRISILQVLLSCARRNKEHIHAVLQYYHDKHINEPFRFKSQFVKNFISRVDNIYYFDEKSWNILNQLYHSMEVYVASNNNVQSFVRAILVRNIINTKEIPDIIKQKFELNTLEDQIKKLKTDKDKNAVFAYLYKIIEEKLETLNLSVENEFQEAVPLCEMLLNLIKDWKKNLSDYPGALETVKQLIDANKANKWNHDLSSLYNLNKSWKKEMFDQSLVLFPSESVCMNALMHDPELLTRRKNEVVAICVNDNVQLGHVINKIRVYWPDTLAKDWRNKYLERLGETEGHKALVSGLCSLLPQLEFNEFLRKYAPSVTKIEWEEDDQLALSLRKQIAKNALKARPLASIKEILPYAKGDYLQFAVPSVSSNLSQLSSIKCKELLPVLLDAPVSLQKFGIRCACDKLSIEELKPLLRDIWNSTKNSSIRTVLFTNTYSTLCKERNVVRANDIWEILSSFIDKLTAEENRLIYQKLGNIDKVPDCVKPQFFMKSYTFLSSLPPKCNCEHLVQNLYYSATEIMEYLDDDFVVNILLKDVVETLKTKDSIYEMVRIISSFILSSKDEDMQIRRYQKSLAPVLKEVLPLWETVYEEKYRIKEHVKNIMERMCNEMDTFTFYKKLHIPVKTYEMIQSQLENSLSYDKEYVFLTIWKLVTMFARLLSENSHVIVDTNTKDENSMNEEEKEQMFSEAQQAIAPSFVKLCLQILKEDMKEFGPIIYILFSEALDTFFYHYTCCPLRNNGQILLYVKCILQSSEEKELWAMAYLFLHQRIEEIHSDSYKQAFEELRDFVQKHDSIEHKRLFVDMF